MHKLLVIALSLISLNCFASTTFYSDGSSSTTID